MPATSPGAVRPAEQKRDVAHPRRRLTFVLGFIIVVLSLCSGFATYVILTGLSPVIPTRTVVNGVLLINLVLVLAMLGIIAWQVTGLWLARRRQAAGAQLHIRIVSLFSVIAIVPAILLAVFASDSLARGLDHWFSVRTKAIIQSSIDVASAYLQEHGQVIRADTVGMAKDIDEAASLVKSRPEEFGNFLTAQAAIRALPVFLGKRRRRLDDFFEVEGAASDEISVRGNLRKVKWIGRNMTRGRIGVVGDVGMHLGSSMKGGVIDVTGNVSDWLGAEMRGGLIRIRGNAGGQVGAAYRGGRCSSSPTTSTGARWPPSSTPASSACSRRRG